jgi:hypothetical protein
MYESDTKAPVLTWVFPEVLIGIGALFCGGVEVFSVKAKDTPGVSSKINNVSKVFIFLSIFLSIFYYIFFPISMELFGCG